MKRSLTAMLALILLAGCGTQVQMPAPTEEPPPSAAQTPSGDLMENVQPDETGANMPLTEEGAVAVTDFGLALFQQCIGQENALVSPLSVILALAMTANGAAGDTFAQMEKAFGMDIDTLNVYLHDYAQTLPDGEGGSVHLANGIWLDADAGFDVEKDFLQTNANYYGAGVEAKPFDGALVDEINAWVAQNTKDRIDKIVDDLSPGAVMMLVNALAFDGVWEDIYREDQVQPGTFTTAGGEEQDATFMHSTEQALQDENAVGFIKYYEGRGYAFAALLPNEGIDLADYAASLTGEKLQRMLSAEDGDGYRKVAVPKFSARYSAELSSALAAMGMTDAFDSEKADFSRISAEAELYISQVMHKTFISVDEKGTQAGAATAVEIREATALGPDMTVYLDRPFVYMLIDCQAKVPIFLGAVTDLGQ